MLINNIMQRIRDDILIRINSYIEATTCRPDSSIGITPYTDKKDSVEVKNNVYKTASCLQIRSLLILTYLAETKISERLYALSAYTSKDDKESDSDSGVRI